MLLLNALRTARAAHSASEADFCLSVSDPRVVKVGGWVSEPEGDAFKRAARAAGYRTVSDCLRDLVLMGGSSVSFLQDLRQRRPEKLDQLHSGVAV
jgi:hypothetical protein